MINLQEAEPLAMLQQFADFLGAEVREQIGAASLTINNAKGKGSITLYEVFPGLTAWIYNITLHEKLVIDLKFSENRPIYFGYNINGHQMQRFPDEEEYKKIGQGQDFILISEPGSKSEFVIPPVESYKCCYLIVSPKVLRQSAVKSKQILRTNLIKAFEGSGSERPYRYLGNIDLMAGKYAEILTNNKRTDLVGRLITEGAISNMMAAQMNAHSKTIERCGINYSHTTDELGRISRIGDFVHENIGSHITVAKVCAHIGISQNKLQTGMQYLYGCTANEFIVNVRMELARELIHSAEMSISEICDVIGISSRSYFSKRFKERFGVLPKEYNQLDNREDLCYELCYRSFCSEGITGSDLDEIVRTSRVRNVKHNITGCLVHQNGVFFQMIEGRKDILLDLYAEIKADPRHYDVTTIWKGSKAKRDFKKWKMAYVTDHQHLTIPVQGNSSLLNLGHLMGDILDQSFASLSLWRKVRYLIRENQNIPVPTI